MVSRHEFTVPASYSRREVFDWVKSEVFPSLKTPLADSYFDYAPVPLPEKAADQGREVRYMLYCAERSQLDRILLPLQASRLQVVRLEVPELALARLVHCGWGISDLSVSQVVLLVDFRAADANIYTLSRTSCHWLGRLKSPAENDVSKESVEIFTSGMQRLMVSLNGTPEVVLLAGKSKVTERAMHWLGALFTNKPIQEINHLLPLPGNALLAAATAAN